MAENVQMIALSPTMEEGTILKWSMQVGDSVSTGDVLCEVETDKASMEYESAQEGVLLSIIVPEGGGAKVGDVIAIIGESGEDISGLEAEAKSAKSAALAATAPETADKPVAVEAPNSQGASSTPATTRSSGGGSSPTSGSGKSSPLARKIAEEKGLDISQIPGSGPGGRVVKRDVETFSPTASTAGNQGVAVSSGAPMTFAPARTAGEDVEIPVAGKRAVIAKRLAESKFSAPHYYLKNSVEMDSLVAARNMVNKEVPSKVSFNAFIMKMVAEALKRYPQVNAGWFGDKIVQFGSIDIGLAVDLGNGLITPIVRNVGNKGVVQIDSELKVLIEKVGNGSLKPDEYTAATFSISNLGSFGVEEFTAIINPPGSAILALGEVKKTPVFDENGELKAANLMKMTLSCDHRVIDGAMGGKFLSELKKTIENPVRVLF
ncbi:MAG: 2-oxo acid dehydrogenase subunit E2 [Spirochaetales bacterium]|nr:2-oxo acid dehydrogenase subunit E2 [Spirochaetales bacterium]